MKASGDVTAAMAPWSNGRTFLNFVEEPSDVSAAFTASHWTELRRIRTEVDRNALFQSTHEIPLATPTD